MHLTTTFKGNLVLLSLRNVSCHAVIDTGASISCISEDLISKIIPKISKYDPSEHPLIFGVGGEKHDIMGCITLPVCIQGAKYLQKFYIFRALHTPVILGLDFLTKHKVNIDHATSTITLSDTEQTVQLIHPSSKSRLLRTECDTVIPKKSEIILNLKQGGKYKNETQYIEPVQFLANQHCLMGSK